jgi:DNA-binding IclR family transcriptional regulator
MNEQDPAEEVKVKSLGKALGLLALFTQANPERGITELATLSGLLKSTVHNMVSTFETLGFLEKNAATGKYRLGAAILKLSNNLYLSHDLRNILRPSLERLSAESGENVYLATNFEDQVIYIDAVYPSTSYSGRSIIGTSAPLYCTGVGKALMAELDDDRVAAIAAAGLQSFTPNTLTDLEALRADLARTRERGYAIDDMEHEFGIRCVAVAIRNIRGIAVASVSLSGPSPRFTDLTIAKRGAALIEMSNRLKSLIQR